MGVRDEPFDDFYRKHAPAVFRRARSLLRSEADAHEVVQDLFLSLYERPEQYAGKSSVTTFLYSATTHTCLNRLRNRKNRARLLEQETRGQESQRPVPVDAMSALRDLLSRMPEPLAQVAVYYYSDELTHEEIARILGCSRRQVGNHLERLDTWLKQETP